MDDYVCACRIRIQEYRPLPHKFTLSSTNGEDQPIHIPSLRITSASIYLAIKNAKIVMGTRHTETDTETERKRRGGGRLVASPVTEGTQMPSTRMKSVMTFLRTYGNPLGWLSLVTDTEDTLLFSTNAPWPEYVLYRLSVIRRDWTSKPPSRTLPPPVGIAH